ncbi:hypothetical protein BU25DRAFT_467306 [Macroventuria anomochaeta]|uniref:Uncharacterized protein n=1 Tax=Macroventuria anomochaeta TaxID=301207 RepID=A0ACB6S3G6_9PLEO|nr:uncharacterized protein BU25DRAFT_467306 [Macroventuria anomochaeta]KAF2628579.1 hypothetical protein BU25DRAFT_467306 [Macroventuria anomochaeta]
MVIFTIGTHSINSVILGWCASVCGQTREKKAAAVSIVMTVMVSSTIWTPYLWNPADEPRYACACFGCWVLYGYRGLCLGCEVCHSSSQQGFGAEW